MQVTQTILNQTDSGFALKKPLTITIQKPVIDILNNIYVKDGEKGGLMWLKAIDNKTAVIEKISVLGNLSEDNTKFDPDEKEMQATIDVIIKSGCLPLVFHTHPTVLGINLYDNRKENFYLRASRPDRLFASKSLIDDIDLYMPEMIFVKDERYNDGYAIALYGGKILPGGFSRLSTLQFVVVGALGYLWLRKGLTPTAWAVGVGLILWEETKRPKYESSSDGSYIISF